MWPSGSTVDYWDPFILKDHIPRDENPLVHDARFLSDANPFVSGVKIEASSFSNALVATGRRNASHPSPLVRVASLMRLPYSFFIIYLTNQVFFNV